MSKYELLDKLFVENAKGQTKSFDASPIPDGIYNVLIDEFFADERVKGTDDLMFKLVLRVVPGIYSGLENVALGRKEFFYIRLEKANADESELKKVITRASIRLNHLDLRVGESITIGEAVKKIGNYKIEQEPLVLTINTVNNFRNVNLYVRKTLPEKYRK